MTTPDDRPTVDVAVEVNGRTTDMTVPTSAVLSDLLREEFGLQGVRTSCERTVCGACTVLVDGVAVRSCLMLAVQADGRAVDTVEGLGAPDALHPLQEAFRDTHAFQCGFCTPGFVMTTVALLHDEPSPSEERVREELSGNVCRCTGYGRILAAVHAAASQRSGDD